MPAAVNFDVVSAAVGFEVVSDTVVEIIVKNVDVNDEVCY